MKYSTAIAVSALVVPAMTILLSVTEITYPFPLIFFIAFSVSVRLTLPIRISRSAVVTADSEASFEIRNSAPVFVRRALERYVSRSPETSE